MDHLCSLSSLRHSNQDGVGVILAIVEQIKVLFVDNVNLILSNELSELLSTIMNFKIDIFLKELLDVVDFNTVIYSAELNSVLDTLKICFDKQTEKPVDDICPRFVILIMSGFGPKLLRG
ncbi:hypothetical protein RF11_10611 [Thelohanellus kitauei]|uniref:Uncharacterized protein n=1 Tax=Thelohanellus kitauei TaxID=669202 RepID=A0A0C2N2W6_THEKT|nr:hypothetical protein RF11_10611 [Thelohanellus kitauei]